MEDILNNLELDEILYVTSRDTEYRFIGRKNNFGVTYSINLGRKTLPLITINDALEDFNNHIEINAQWYKNYNQQEYKTRSCNLSVLRNLLKRL